MLAPAIATGMATRGTSVARFGPATTPAMFMSCIQEGEYLAPTRANAIVMLLSFMLYADAQMQPSCVVEYRRTPVYVPQGACQFKHAV